jgi:hypothetical protein
MVKKPLDFLCWRWWAPRVSNLDQAMILDMDGYCEVPRVGDDDGDVRGD